MEKLILSEEVKRVILKYKLKQDREINENEMCNNSFIPPGISKSSGNVFSNNKNGKDYCEVVYPWDLKLFIPFKMIEKNNPYGEDALVSQDWTKFDNSTLFNIYKNEFELCVILNKELGKFNEFVNIIKEFYFSYSLFSKENKKESNIQLWLYEQFGIQIGVKNA